MKTIFYTLSARRQLRRLAPDVQAQIEAKLARYAESGAGDVRALVGHPGKRLRVGDYRVIFVESSDKIEVRALGDRRDVYR